MLIVRLLIFIISTLASVLTKIISAIYSTGNYNKYPNTKKTVGQRWLSLKTQFFPREKQPMNIRFRQWWRIGNAVLEYRPSKKDTRRTSERNIHIQNIPFVIIYLRVGKNRARDSMRKPILYAMNKSKLKVLIVKKKIDLSKTNA